jgi:hypothetical protein
VNLLCTALIEANTKEIVQKWLLKFQNFLRYIMLLSETMNYQKQMSN